MNLSSGQKKCNQGKYPANGIGESCGKFIDAKHLHGNDLQPNKQRWLFPEGFIIDGNRHIVTADDHLPCRFCENDLIPVKQVYRTRKRYQENQSIQDDDQNDPYWFQSKSHQFIILYMDASNHFRSYLLIHIQAIHPATSPRNEPPTTSTRK